MNTQDWTYGAEHEFGDWDRSKGLPPGFKVDERDVTIVNSNGIAADPKAKLYGFGGEINTPPTESPEGQVECLRAIKEMHPNVVVNYRSNLHVHVRVPGLKDDLRMLKRLTLYNQACLRNVLELIEPIPKPTVGEYPVPEDYEGAMVRYKRRKRSHHTLLTDKRIAHQLGAETVKEFFEREVPVSNGKPAWILQPRCAVNIRQLLETDTIEFRHFPGTLAEDELLTCIQWCRDYLVAALDTRENASELFYRMYEGLRFPKFPPYIHWMEKRYRATVHDGTVAKSAIKENIEFFLRQDEAS